MKPLVLAETAQKCRRRFQCAVRGNPFDVYRQPQHFQHSGRVMPRRKNQRQRRIQPPRLRSGNSSQRALHRFSMRQTRGFSRQHVVKLSADSVRVRSARCADQRPLSCLGRSLEKRANIQRDPRPPSCHVFRIKFPASAESDVQRRTASRVPPARGSVRRNNLAR